MKNFIKVLTVVCFCAAALFVYADGGLDEPCIDGYLCNEGLECREGVCVPIEACVDVAFYFIMYSYNDQQDKNCYNDLGSMCGIQRMCEFDEGSLEPCQQTKCWD